MEEGSSREKGLEVARRFFFEWGLPVLQSDFPHYVNRIAAGRLLGSDVLGGDSEVSKDHNWGPQVFLFLTDDDYRQGGDAISEAMNAKAPNPWQGYLLAKGSPSVTVVSTSIFFEKMLGLHQPPRRPQDWPTAITEFESELYFIRHGAVFHDPLGELSSWRDALRQYPRHIHLKRLAAECDRIWHRGAYNFVQRMANRDDPLVNYLCIGEFIEAVMRLYLLAAGDFTPYWKWLPQEFRKQQDVTEIEPLLVRLAVSSDRQEQRLLAQTVCDIVHDHLMTRGFVTGKGAREDHLPLLNDRRELQEQSKIIC